jgi:hypothetical protein
MRWQFEFFFPCCEWKKIAETSSKKDSRKLTELMGREPEPQTRRRMSKTLLAANQSDSSPIREPDPN